MFEKYNIGCFLYLQSFLMNVQYDLGGKAWNHLNGRADGLLSFAALWAESRMTNWSLMQSQSEKIFGAKKRLNNTHVL